MAENVPPASAQATGNKNENSQNSRNNRRGSGNKQRGNSNQRSYSQNRSRNNLNDSSQDEGYYSRGGPRGYNNPRGGKQGPRDDQRMSRQDQENTFNSNNRRGRFAYSSDRTRQGNSTDRNVATHSRDRSLQPVPSTSFGGVHDVFDLIKAGPSNANKDTANKTHGGFNRNKDGPSNANKDTANKTHGGFNRNKDGPSNVNKTHGKSNKNLSKEGHGEEERRLDRNQMFNSSENIHKKRDSESFKRNPNEKYDGNRGHGNHQSNDRPRQMRNENGQHQGPRKNPPNKRGPNNAGGIKVPYKVCKFNNEQYLRENQILNTMQTESHPELFSYEELARELQELKPDPVVKEVKNTINHTVAKRKKAGKLINSVKKSDASQGNIPNEFKRRRKPGRLTILNRIRKGLPVDSDDDEQDYVQVENKRKKASEKKKKVMELLMQRRVLQNEEEAHSMEARDVSDAAYSSDDNVPNATCIENSENDSHVKDQIMEGPEKSISEVPVVHVNIMETTNVSPRESPVSTDIQTDTNKQHNKVVSMTDSSDDSDDNTAEFDKRNQRKFDAFKLSNDLASHLAKHKLGQTKPDTNVTGKDLTKSKDCKTDGVAGLKDLQLTHLKQIIEARKKTENNSAREENKQVEEVGNKMQDLVLNDKRNMVETSNVKSDDKITTLNESQSSEKVANNNIDDREDKETRCETLDDLTVNNANNKLDESRLNKPMLPIASSVEDSGSYTESKIVAPQIGEITPEPGAMISDDSNDRRCDESNASNDNQEVPKDNKTHEKEDQKKEDEEMEEEDEEDDEEETDESDEDIETKLMRALREKLTLTGTLDKPDQVMDYLEQLRQAREVHDDEGYSVPHGATQFTRVEAQCGEDIRVDDQLCTSNNEETKVVAADIMKILVVP
ncbi:hypothetical protein WDU94_000798, partial [Cyamophila willieti]